MEKVFIIVGAGYTVQFSTVKERNRFNKMVDSIYTTMQKDERFSNHQALYKAVSIVTANKMGVNIEIN